MNRIPHRPFTTSPVSTQPAALLLPIVLNRLHDYARGQELRTPCILSTSRCLATIAVRNPG